MTYLEDGHCSLSNNLSENAIRPFTVGRKNWLFSASPKGATASAIVYTMVEMAKANDLNKAGIHYAYLPPYSPDLNPIEKMWSKMKAILRKQKVRVASELPEAVKKALEMIRHTDCEGWFHACGYMH
nr:MAG TPA: Mos transposase [Caudoviricetes sp.]